jgi:dimethylamine/trimethylamine dehydrogenase
VTGPVVVFDDDHYYMGGILAEKLRADGHEVTLITPVGNVSQWTFYSEEQHRIEKQILEQGIDVIYHSNLISVDDGFVEITTVSIDRRQRVECGSLVLVTSRLPNESLYLDLVDKPENLEAAGIVTVTRIGDCLGPSTVANAVFSGHRYARELDNPIEGDVPFRWEAIEP